MTRGHECVHNTPLAVQFTKLPSTAECAEPHCYWQRNCTEVTSATLMDLRALATHHAKALRHRVLIHLRQDVQLIPSGEPAATGGESVPRVQGSDDSQPRSGAPTTKEPA